MSSDRWTPQVPGCPQCTARGAHCGNYHLTPEQREEALASAEALRERMTLEAAARRDQGPHLKNCEAWTGSGCRCSDLGAAQVAREAAESYSMSMHVRVVIGLVAAALAIGGGFALGATHGPSTTDAPSTHAAHDAASTPVEHSAEAGFARDMQIHHAQAVDMSMRVRDLTTDPATRTLAYDIALTQQEQIGEMHGWLASWGLPQTGSDPLMTWMTTGDTTGHNMPGMNMDTTAAAPASATGDPAALMPGMATAADLDRLDTLTGRDAEVLFLQLMIRHHQAGVDMADAILDRTARPEVSTLATAMVKTQQSEIDLMTQMLTERGASL